MATTPDVQRALELCDAINADPFRWAELEVVPLPQERIVRVQWGHIMSDGRREQAIGEIRCDLERDGSVSEIRRAYL